MTIANPSASTPHTAKRRWRTRGRTILLACTVLLLGGAGYLTFSYHHLWLAGLAHWRGDDREARRQARAHHRRHPHSAWADALLKANADTAAVQSQRYAKSDGIAPPPPVETGPKVGQAAPKFTLKTLDDREIRLDRRRAERPMLLHFGSYSCPLFQGEVDGIGELYREFGARVDFFTVYLSENHPFDPDKQQQLPPMFSVRIKEHASYEERRQAAEACRADLGLEMPVLIDTMGDETGAAYAAQPTRIYLIATDGTIAYKNDADGREHSAAQVRAAIVALLAKQTEHTERASEEPPVP